MANFVAKGFCSSERARLIQDQPPTSNVDSKIHSSRFDRCAFLFYSFRAATLATKSATSRRRLLAELSPKVSIFVLQQCRGTALMQR
jgi:hypothetical protein